MSRTPNAQYNVAAPASLAVRVATWQRRRMFADFLIQCGVSVNDRVLDVGATSDQAYESSNYLEAWLENKSRIVAAGVDEAGFLMGPYPGLSVVRANGLQLPFADGTFDVVHSSAVLEHVGAYANQVGFIRECARVARRSFCLTTPNRWFPVEFHTVLPLVHWLPKPWFRRLMATTGRAFFASEANLNLLSAGELSRAANEALAGSGFKVRIRRVRLLGLGSNLMLYGTREEPRVP